MTLLTLGVPHTILQNIAYAAPVRAAHIFVQAGAAIEQSNDGTTWGAATLDTNDSFINAAQFIRTTAASAIVSLKAA